jgi:hypothetical protein
MAEILSAVFRNPQDAQDAIQWLRGEHVPDDAISVISQHGGGATAHGGNGEAKDDAADAGKGALTGAGVGAGVGLLFGLAAAAIPGAGPFIAAGALAHALGVTGGAAAAGAIVGGTSGGLAGALSHWGLNEAESQYYSGEVEKGGTLVGVDLSQANLDRGTVLDTFRRFNGNYAV